MIIDSYPILPTVCRKGNPNSKESGRLYSGITARLMEAGFANVKKVERAFGLVATAGPKSNRNRLLSRSATLSGDDLFSTD